MIHIPLTQGQHAIIDEMDEWRVRNFNWYALRNRKWFYAYSSNIPNILMHRLILNAPNDLVVDHVNGNGLDNRRCNIRLCTRAQNGWNTPKYKGGSKFKGVYFDKERNKWKAQININRKRIRLGRYVTEQEAAKAYDTACIELHGKFGRLNFPETFTNDITHDRYPQSLADCSPRRRGIHFLHHHHTAISEVLTIPKYFLWSRHP